MEYEEKKPGAEGAAGGELIPFEAEKPPFTAHARELAAALILTAAAYLYVDRFERFLEGGNGWLVLFAGLYLLAAELVHRGTRRPWESFIWLGCLLCPLAGITLRRTAVWDEFLQFFFLHVFAVWWLLSRSDLLTEGISGRFIPLDALRGAVLLPFKHYFLRARTLWFYLRSLRKKETGAEPVTVTFTVIALLVAFVLFLAAAGLLGLADEDFGAMLDRVRETFAIHLDGFVFFQLMLSLPVGAYLFGLVGGAGREDREKLRAVPSQVDGFLAELRHVPDAVWIGAIAAFSALYLAFFTFQARYLFGAFTRTLPEGFIVSQYARQGFFELLKVMAVNFALLWAVARTGRTSCRESVLLRGLCLLLLLESAVFAVIALSKLWLYISSFGFTPKRLQSTWLALTLLFGTGCAARTLLTGKRSMRAFLVFGAVTLSALCLF